MIGRANPGNAAEQAPGCGGQQVS